MKTDKYGRHENFKICGVPQRFRWIKPGTFLMGSPEDEPERYEDEQQHEVTLTKGYWLGGTACTQKLWEAVMGNNPSRFKGPNRPVERVSWYDVQEFLEKINEKYPDQDFRLPTEAEWEYACRAGTITAFSFGENINTEQVNYDGEYPYSNAEKGEDRGETVPVKSLPPNQWELYEIHGNVWEWCSDRYGHYSEDAVVDPTGPESCDSDGNWFNYGEAYRMLRGGSWGGCFGRDTRSAYRNYGSPTLRFRVSGFRLAQSQKQEKKKGNKNEKRK